ncbi:hypothetical protein BDW42DRAFT_63445 [Aspergillus taichungensis]|uniref:F-box domain-containing protein n=1 Tax=Aspergillus taichungensis TaxID=482145 RepID=A0A2J5HCT3_9EURO|nr:hypothetical protein BDW42DRAFT_63445 [Aspergillus taichungensis]
MGWVLNLPTELIIRIFESLDDIDDALHFARCCKDLHCVFDPLSARFKIFRSIIARASHHENDIELSQRVNLYGRFSQDFYESRRIPSNPTHRKSLVSRYLNPLDSSEDVPAEFIWDIVCRWQGMRVLYDLYCDPAVNEAYLASTFPNIQTPPIPDHSEAMASEPALLPPAGSVCPAFVKMSQRERQKSYQRFYKAVTRHWISVESLWLVRTQFFPSEAEFDEAFERTRDAWTHNPTRPAPEKIDIIEVVDFVWGFLGRKAFHVSSFPEWREGLGSIAYDYRDPHETEFDNWEYFLSDILQHPRPPHLIELLLWMWNSSGWRLNRSGFLRRLGLLDAEERIDNDESGSTYIGSWLETATVEEDLESSFTHVQDVDTFTSQWKEYRSERWPREARARVFFRNLTTEELFTQITGKEILS